MDVAILIILAVGTLIGFKLGFLEISVKFLGFIVMMFGGYFLKNPISEIMYNNLPFFKFGGLLEGVSVINIILYEFIAFLIIFILLFIVLRIISVFTKIIDKIFTFILNIGIPSGVLGAVVGFVASYLILYVGLFIFTFMANFVGLEIDSSLAGKIMATPVLKDTFGTTLNAFSEISELSMDFNETSDKSEYNYKALDIVLKYKIISTDNAKKLLLDGKLTIPNSGKLIAKYEEE